MKKNISSSHMPMLALAAGLSGAFARIILYRLGTDGQGLLIRNHPLHILCWILSAATVVCLWTAVKKSPEPAAASNSYDPVFPLSLACAWGIGVTVVRRMWSIICLMRCWNKVMIREYNERRSDICKSNRS